jgi:predicted DNA-binding transcriptional regulator AlpA
MSVNRSAGPKEPRVEQQKLQLTRPEPNLRRLERGAIVRQSFSGGQYKVVLVGKPSRQLRAPPRGPELQAQAAAQGGTGQEVHPASQLAETNEPSGRAPCLAQDAVQVGLANYHPTSNAPPAAAKACANQETPPTNAPDGARATPQQAEPKTAPPAKLLAPSSSASGLLNEKQAAAMLGLEPATLRNWRVKGHRPRFVQLSRRAIRYSRSDIDEWIANRVRRSTSAPEASND